MDGYYESEQSTFFFITHHLGAYSCPELIDTAENVFLSALTDVVQLVCDLFMSYVCLNHLAEWGLESREMFLNLLVSRRILES